MQITKEEIKQIRIDVESQGQSALSMMIDKDGSLGRQGFGTLPPVKASAIGMTNGKVFKKLINVLDDRILAQPGTYKVEKPVGVPIKYRLALIGEKPKVCYLEFHVGSNNQDVGPLLPLVDRLTTTAVRSTNTWYKRTLAGKPEKRWWQLWK